MLDVEPENVLYKGRLQPGKMFLVDFEEGRIIADQELKEKVSSARTYEQWLTNQRLTMDELPAQSVAPSFIGEDLVCPDEGIWFYHRNHAVYAHSTH